MAIKNTLVDLNNHLFEQLERLNDDDLTDKELEKEIRRAKSMASIAQAIVANAGLGIKAERLRVEHRNSVNLPEMLENNK